MYIVRHIEDLHRIIRIWRKYNSTTGFVPTMGALHAGHLELVRAARKSDTFTVVSIFVNPTQFNDKKDLDKYPRTEKEDLVKLEAEGVDILFLPDAEEIYPEGGFRMPEMKLGHLMNKLDGVMRPGHFEGVIQVVYRFLDLIRPDRIFMGLKDFQQQLIIREMMLQAGMQVELITVPTVRESNGLAMSSRNSRLTEEERGNAAVLYGVLGKIRKSILKEENFEDACREGIKELENAGMKVEYIQWVDAGTLEPSTGNEEESILMAAVRTGEVRLIDNILV